MIQSQQPKVRIKLSGVSFCQKAIQECRVGQEVFLKREPENEYDTNAISVILGKEKIGYIPADIAKKMSPPLDSGKVQVIESEILSIQGRKTVGVDIVIRLG